MCRGGREPEESARSRLVLVPRDSGEPVEMGPCWPGATTPDWIVDRCPLAAHNCTQSINQFTISVFRTHDGSQQTINGKTTYTKH